VCSNNLEFMCPGGFPNNNAFSMCIDRRTKTVRNLENLRKQLNATSRIQNDMQAMMVSLAYR